MIKSPSALARIALVTKLADSSLGINATYAQVVSNYLGAGQLSLNFQFPSTNVFLGRVTLDEIIATGTFTWPLMVVYTTAGKDQSGSGGQKSVLFDGPVTAVVSLYLSSQQYVASAMQSNFEVWMDAAEETLLTVFNKLTNQNWGPNVTYNGGLAFERGEVTKAGTNWLQPIFVRMPFRVTVP